MKLAKNQPRTMSEKMQVRRETVALMRTASHRIPTVELMWAEISIQWSRFWAAVWENIRNLGIWHTGIKLMEGEWGCIPCRVS